MPFIRINYLFAYSKLNMVNNQADGG
jgi:hypothetical protein